MLMRRKGLHSPWSEIPMYRSSSVAMNPQRPAVVEFGAAAQSRERFRPQRSCLCIERGWNSFLAILTKHIWCLLCWWVSEWSDTAANPVSLALIRLESSGAGVLLILPGKESKG